MSDTVPLDIDLTSDQISDRLRRGGERMDRLEERMEKLEEAMSLNTSLTTEVHDVIVMARSFFRGLQRIANGVGWAVRGLVRIARPIGALAAAATAIYIAVYALLHNGATPK